MLEQICRNLRNFFVKQIYSDTFKIISGSLVDVDFLMPGQYFKIDGSVFNDGVYMYPATGLVDEEFTGQIWAMAVPPAVIALSDDIAAWCDKNKDLLDSPFSSESFGGYSYSKGTSKSGGSLGWQSAFSSRLNEWRKI